MNKNKQKPKKSKKNKQKKEVFLKTLVQNLGNITKTCEKTGISRGAHYLWLENDEEYRKAYEEIPEIEKDKYKEAFDKLIAKEHPAAVIFAMKAKLGWVETQKIEHGGELRQSINWQEVYKKAQEDK